MEGEGSGRVGLMEEMRETAADDKENGRVGEMRVTLWPGQKPLPGNHKVICQPRISSANEIVHFIARGSDISVENKIPSVLFSIA